MLLLVRGGWRLAPEPGVRWSGMKGEMSVMWSRWWPRIEEKANSGIEGYEGKESKSICSGDRSLNCGSPARNWATWSGAVHISPGVRSVGWVGQLKRWATVWSVELQSEQVGSSAQPMEWRYRTWAASNSRNGAVRGSSGMTAVAVVRQGQLKGGGHGHLVGCLGPNGLLYHPGSEGASGQEISALFQHASEDEGGGVWVVTSNSQASDMRPGE